MHKDRRLHPYCSSFYDCSTANLIIRLSSSTLTGTTTPVKATTTTTQGPGPVQQPAPTTATPGAPFVYTYTTVQNGVSQTVTDTFTPTNPPTSTVTAPAIGTIWAYSSWYTIYGPPKGSTGNRVAVPLLEILLGLFVWLI